MRSVDNRHKPNRGSPLLKGVSLANYAIQQLRGQAGVLYAEGGL